MIVLVDGDTVVFRCCCATEYTTYEVDGLGVFRRKKDLLAVLKANYDEDEQPPYVIGKQTEPPENTYHLINQMMDNIKMRTGANECEVYLQGKDNFRKSIPYPVEYKGNRGEKPSNYGIAVQYLMNKYHAVQVDGMEADDMLAIRLTELADKGIVASVDKDLLQVPGYHYNITSQDIRTVTPDEGIRSYYVQVLMGDGTDNVVGLYGVGPVIAGKLVDKCRTVEEMEAMVKEKYQFSFGQEKGDMMLEANKKLLWLLRERVNVEGL